MLIGYARISTDDQKLDLQHDTRCGQPAARRSSTRRRRVASIRLPVREELLDYARRGDTVVVWKLDRLGRSLRDLIEVVNTLGERGVGLRSLHESIDTTTPAGKLTFHVFAALSEFECDLLRERTRAGLMAAQKRGAKLGRPRSLTPQQVEMARSMMANPNLSARRVATQLGVHRSTLYRNLAAT